MQTRNENGGLASAEHLPSTTVKKTKITMKSKVMLQARWTVPFGSDVQELNNIVNV